MHNRIFFGLLLEKPIFPSQSVCESGVENAQDPSPLSQNHNEAVTRDLPQKIEKRFREGMQRVSTPTSLYHYVTTKIEISRP